MKWIFIFGSVIALAFEGCTRNSGRIMSVQLAIADDQDQFWTKRIDAVAKLDARDREELRRMSNDKWKAIIQGRNSSKTN